MGRPLIIHMDMKGGPPNPQYLTELLSLFKRWGATGILLEWEDMFPWSQDFEILRCEHHYSLDDVEHILSVASGLQLEVIPLVQTFGHLEFLLKHEKYKHLREMPLYPNSLRPVDVNQDGDSGCWKSEGLTAVCGMVQQVINLHTRLGQNTFKRIHIGCDEVWYLGNSAITSAYMEAHGLNKEDIFLRHMKAVAEYVKDQSPGLEVLCWDDMMRSADVSKLREFGLSDLVQPVVWNYSPRLTFPHGMIERYNDTWSNRKIWAGTAWRGATGPCVQVTNMTHHLNNHLAWLQVPEMMGGWILTGWARYDHYATMCELLPVSLPSLRLCMATLENSGFNSEVHTKASKELGMKNPVPLDPMAENLKDVDGGDFPGNQLYSLMLRYGLVENRTNNALRGQNRQTWCNPWQIEHKLLNPIQVKPMFEEIRALSQQLRDLEPQLWKEISNYLNRSTADEWVGSNIKPKLRELDDLSEKLVSALPVLGQLAS